MHSHNKRSRYYQRNTSVNLVAVGGEAMRSRRRQPEKLVTCTCPVKTFHDTVMARSCLPLSGKCPGLDSNRLQPWSRRDVTSFGSGYGEDGSYADACDVYIAHARQGSVEINFLHAQRNGADGPLQNSTLQLPCSKVFSCPS